MRRIAIFPILFAAGYTLGLLLFQRPKPPAFTEEKGRGGDSDGMARAGAVDRTTTEEKAQRVLVAAMRKGSQVDRFSDIHLAIEALTAADFRNLMLDVGAMKAMGERLQKIDQETARALAAGLIGRWVELDAEAAVAFVPRIFDLMPNADNRALVLDALAAKRPEEMLASVAGRKSAREREEIISRALRELAAKDPAKAQAWLRACTDPADRKAAETAYRFGMVQANPLRAVALAGEIDNDLVGYDLMRVAAEKAMVMGLNTARQLATTPMPGWMLAPVLGEIAEKDPELAVELALKSQEDGTFAAQVFSLQSAFSGLAKKDPAAAAAKLEGLTNIGLASAVAAVGREWAASDPAAALNWLASRAPVERIDPHRAGTGTSDALLMTFSDWVRSGRTSALAWADTLPAGETRDLVQGQLARTLAAQEEFDEAAKVISQVGERVDPKVLVGIARSWTEKDPAAAAHWTIGLPAGPLQNRTLTSVVGSWSNVDPHAVQDWLTQFPAGETRDASVAAYLNRNNAWLSGPERRSADFDAWFDLIEDPWQRANVATRSYWERRNRDPKAAREWLARVPNVDATVIAMTLRAEDEE